MSAKYKIELVNGALNYYLGAKNTTSSVQIYTKFKDKKYQNSKDNHESPGLPLYLGFLNPYQCRFNLGIGLSSPLTVPYQTQYWYDGSDIFQKQIDVDVLFNESCWGTTQGGSTADNSLQYKGVGDELESTYWELTGYSYFRPTGNNTGNIICAKNDGSNRSIRLKSLRSFSGTNNEPRSWGMSVIGNISMSTLPLRNERTGEKLRTPYPYYNIPYYDDNTFEATSEYINQIPYDVFTCSDNVALYYEGNSSNTDMFSYIYVVKTTDNSIVNFPGYHKVNGVGTGACTTAIILSYTNNLELASPNQIIAKFTPSEIHAPANLTGESNHIYPVAIKASDGTGGYHLSDAAALRGKIPWVNNSIKNEIANSGNESSPFGPYLSNYSNDTIKALPLIMYFKGNDSEPYALFQPFSAEKMANTKTTVEAPGTIYATQACGHTQVIPYFTNSESHTVDWNSALLDETKVLAPDLIPTHGDMTVIDNVVDRISFNDALTDPSDKGGGNLSTYSADNAKLGLPASGSYGYYNWPKQVTNPLQSYVMLDIPDDVAVVSLTSVSNTVSVTITPTRSTNYTYGQVNTYQFPIGNDYIADLFGSLGLVNGTVTLSNMARLCVFRNIKDVMVSNHLFKPRNPSTEIDIVTCGYKPDGSTFDSSTNQGTIWNAESQFDNLVVAYPKVVVPDYTWWPAACNFELYSYDKFGNKVISASVEWNGATFNDVTPDAPATGPVIPEPPSVDNPSNGESATPVLYVKV